MTCPFCQRGDYCADNATLSSAVVREHQVVEPGYVTSIGHSGSGPVNTESGGESDQPVTASWTTWEADHRALEEAIKRIYDRYATDLAAFMRDVVRDQERRRASQR